MPKKDYSHYTREQLVAKQLEKLVREISSESKLQKKILDAYWKEKFGVMFNEKEIASTEQHKLF